MYKESQRQSIFIFSYFHVFAIEIFVSHYYLLLLTFSSNLLNYNSKANNIENPILNFNLHIFCYIRIDFYFSENALVPVSSTSS